jgi:hypothetical protein
MFNGRLASVIIKSSIYIYGYDGCFLVVTEDVDLEESFEEVKCISR